MHVSSMSAQKHQSPANSRHPLRTRTRAKYVTGRVPVGGFWEAMYPFVLVPWRTEARPWVRGGAVPINGKGWAVYLRPGSAARLTPSLTQLHIILGTADTRGAIR